LKASHLKQGEDAELACCHYLQSRGLKLLEKNFNCRLGEIDIIMIDKNVLVFVEVRFRKNSNFGSGLESITPAKQNKLRKAAELFLQQNTRYKNARFDVVSMSKNNQTMADNNAAGKQTYTYDWITNAF
jgi:putative endonuclease